VTPEPQPEQGFIFRSDNFSFANAGVPALYERAGLDDSARGPVWGRAQLEDYAAHRYRSRAISIHPTGMLRGALDDLRLLRKSACGGAHARFPALVFNSEFRGEPRLPAAP